MTPIVPILRSALLAGFLGLGCGSLSLAQEVTAPATVEELFGKLVQLQEANLGIARQIAETQLRAADAIQVALDEGGVEDAALKKLGQAFIDNARTLASVVLVPMGTENVSAGETLQRLLRANIAMFERSRGAARSNPDLASAFEKYSVLQTQSQDLLVALANGWHRYGEVVRTAEIAGMIRAGSFDSGDATWTLVNPDLQAAAAATAAPEPEAREQAPVEPTPVPALSGTPRGPSGEAAQPAAAEPVPATLPQPPAEPLPDITGTTGPARLDSTGPLALADIKPDGSGKIGDWTIEADGTGLFIASSSNLNEGTADRIAGVTIACGENGMLYYQFAARTDYPSWVVYSDDALSRTVSAETNIVKGADASALSDTMRLAFDWAGRDPDRKRRITVAAVDDDEVPAQFSPSGYMEARGRVLDACVQGIVSKAMSDTPVTQTAAAAVPESQLPPGAVIKPGLIAPTPKQRPATFRKQGPVDIMSGT